MVFNFFYCLLCSVDISILFLAKTLHHFQFTERCRIILSYSQKTAKGWCLYNTKICNLFNIAQPAAQGPQNIRIHFDFVAVYTTSYFVAEFTRTFKLPTIKSNKQLVALLQKGKILPACTDKPSTLYFYPVYSAKPCEAAFPTQKLTVRK